LSALSSQVFGLNDFAITLPSRCGGLGCVAMTYLLARRHTGVAAGWFAAVILVTNGVYIQFTTSFRMDSLMTLGALLTLWGYLNLQHARGVAALCGGIMISALTKGPLIFVMLLIFVPHAAVVGHWRHTHRTIRYWILLLALPTAWYGTLWLMHGPEISSQLEHDFWRGDTAIGLNAVDSALLEYAVKPARRLWPWLPLIVLALVNAFVNGFRRHQAVSRRADYALLIGLFVLNYGIAAIKPDPDVRYLYPSLPLVAILCGDLIVRWTRERLPRYCVKITVLLIALGSVYVGVMSYRGLPDRDGLQAVQALARAGELTATNAVIIDETLAAPTAPRRNIPLPDSVYYYFGIKPAVMLWPATAAELPDSAQFVIVRRKRIYEATLRNMGLRALVRSKKIALFERRWAD
jgi:4-amino-4-deoxy-L-arabinose transferase-like glycosyltransferase